MNEGIATHELCYICGRPLAYEECDTEHVVPKGLFIPDDRQDCIKLPAHKSCNNSFSKDDEYFRLCMTALANPHNDKASKLWHGKVMRGFHRPDWRGLKNAVLRDLTMGEVRSEAGLILGTTPILLGDAKRIQRVINRITRGLYRRRTEKTLSADWPVDCDMFELGQAPPNIFEMEFFRFGNGTFSYASKFLNEDRREAIFWLVFYEYLHFWSYTGTIFRDLARGAGDA